MAMANKPPRHTLPLGWNGYNGCRVTEPGQRAANLKVAAPYAADYETLRTWLLSLSSYDCRAWFAAIGWPEGDHYWGNLVWYESTGGPKLVADVAAAVAGYHNNKCTCASCEALRAKRNRLAWRVAVPEQMWASDDCLFNVERDGDYFVASYYHQGERYEDSPAIHVGPPFASLAMAQEFCENYHHE